MPFQGGSGSRAFRSTSTGNSGMLGYHWCSPWGDDGVEETLSVVLGAGIVVGNDQEWDQLLQQAARADHRRQQHHHVDREQLVRMQPQPAPLRATTACTPSSSTSIPITT